MATHVQEFKSKNDYEKWLNGMGSKIRVINLATSRKSWSMWTGMANLENAQTYTVTYEDVETALPAPSLLPSVQSQIKLCSNCNFSNAPNLNFCENCGTPLFKPSALT